MWIGGVRVVILDEEKKILMLKQYHEEKDIWMVPGGAIEENENAEMAAIREVKEETGLEIELLKLIWHVEEVSEKRGQRFVNFFLARIVGGSLYLGIDPEREADKQVMREVKFMSQMELKNLEVLYPEYLKDELWIFLQQDTDDYNAFKIRR